MCACNYVYKYFRLRSNSPAYSTSEYTENICTDIKTPKKGRSKLLKTISMFSTSSVQSPSTQHENLIDFPSHTLHRNARLINNHDSVIPCNMNHNQEYQKHQNVNCKKEFRPK